MALKDFMAVRAGRDGAAVDEPTALPAAAARVVRTVAPLTSIDATSAFEGTLHAKETVRIDGHLSGELICDKTVLIGEGARVKARIVAETVHVSGEVKGDITARCKLTLDRTARVTGDLTTPGIVIEEGARLEGRIMIGSQDGREAKAGRNELKAGATEPKASRTEPKAGKTEQSVGTAQGASAAPC